MFNQQ